MIKIMIIFGTRPEVIKFAPIIKELCLRTNVKTLICNTAQQREMLDQTMKNFDITPTYDLNIMKVNQNLSELTSTLITKIDCIVKKEKIDLILAHGDTTTAFAASLVGFYNNILVGHVEAGLRTFSKRSPFPEEVNRQFIGIMADFHFAPTQNAAQNLFNEGRGANQVFITGNTIIDAMQLAVCPVYYHPILKKIKDGKFILVTLRRRENIGKAMEEVLAALERVINEFTDFHIIFPMHLNPNIRTIAEKIVSCNKRIHLIPSLDYIDFQNFMIKSHFIVTDSGGIQEEAPMLGKPVLVARETTERPEGINMGNSKLIGTSGENVYKECKNLILNKKEYEQMSVINNLYGEIGASKKIVDIIINFFQRNSSDLNF